MGLEHSKSRIINDEDYFRIRKYEKVKYLSKIHGFLENTCEWVVALKEKLEEHKDKGWSETFLTHINSWRFDQDGSSRVAFALIRYDSMREATRLDQTKSCKWRGSFGDLQTFSYEVDSDPKKKTLNVFLTGRQDCSLYRIIKTFKKSMIETYCIKEINNLALKPQVISKIGHHSKEIDDGIIQFCKIMADVIPKFFFSFPENIDDIQSILRNSIISDEIFKLLVMTRKELQRDKEDEYLQNLQSFTFQKNDSPIRKYLERENNPNYVNALENLIQITIAKSLGEMQDCVAWLSAYISMSLYDPERPDHEYGEDDKIEAFQYIIARTSAPDLPLYLDILNTFIDESILNFKDIGQDITRLYFALTCPSTKK